MAQTSYQECVDGKSAEQTLDFFVPRNKVGTKEAIQLALLKSASMKELRSRMWLSVAAYRGGHRGGRADHLKTAISERTVDQSICVSVSQILREVVAVERLILTGTNSSMRRRSFFCTGFFTNCGSFRVSDSRTKMVSPFSPCGRSWKEASTKSHNRNGCKQHFMEQRVHVCMHQVAQVLAEMSRLFSRSTFRNISSMCQC